MRAFGKAWRGQNASRSGRGCRRCQNGVPVASCSLFLSLLLFPACHSATPAALLSQPFLFYHDLKSWVQTFQRQSVCRPFFASSVFVLTGWNAAAKLFSNKEMRLLMLGLDAAGKTSACFSHLFIIDVYSLADRRSYSVQAEVEPIRHNHPDR